MKIKILLVVAILALALTGCSSVEERNLVDEGRAALEKYEYTQAKELLSEALEIDSADEHARAMYVQASKMLNVMQYQKQRNYEKAIKEIEIIENIKNGSSEIKNEAERKKKEIKKEKDAYDKELARLKENAKYTADKDTYRVEQQAITENQKVQEANRKEEEKKEQQQEQQQENTQNNGDNQQQGATTPKPDAEPTNVVSDPNVIISN